MGTGSVFWFELIAALNRTLQSVEPAACTRTCRSGARLRTLLYVEDNPANLNWSSNSLRAAPSCACLSR